MQVSEAERVGALHRYEILDSPREPTFDIITSTLAQLLDVPLACISLVDRDRVWFKASVGLEVPEVEREDGFCSTLVATEEEVRHIQDAADHPDTSGHSLVCGAGIRFYAGAPLRTPEGFRIGTLCAFGASARDLSEAERSALLNMATLVMNEIEARRSRRELQRTEAALRRAQRLEGIGMVASGVAHDFNNLLCGILGNAELLRDRLRDQPDDLHLAAEIFRTGRRAADLVGQVLTYAGHDDDQPMEPVDLNALVAETHRLLASSVETAVQIELDLAPGLPAVQGQSTGLRQLVLNLAKNAAEACTGRAGRACLATRRGSTAGTVALVVSDDGCGMTAEERERIFEPFYSSKSGARGLGLAICRRICDVHGAQIEMESEVDAGTTFRVLLPAAAAAPLDETQTGEIRLSDWGPGTILVVDDEASIRDLVRRCLDRAGYAVLSASGGEEALEHLEGRQRIDAVVLDWNMPGMSGEGVLLAMRRRGIDVPVILSSGHAERVARDRTSAYGIAGFLKKPWRLHELLDQIEAVLH